MFSTTAPVTPADTRPLVADLEGFDPTAPGYGHHLAFDKILRRCGLAWTAFLHSLEGFEGGVIVPRLEVDYLAEVGVGTLEVDVTVVSIGRTSFRICCAASQDGRPAARVHVVLVSFGYDEKTPLPLTHSQRAQLEAHLE